MHILAVYHCIARSAGALLFSMNGGSLTPLYHSLLHCRQSTDVMQHLKDLRANLIKATRGLYASPLKILLQGRSAATEHFSERAAKMHGTRLQEDDFDNMLLQACDHYLASVMSMAKMLLCRVEVASVVRGTARHLLGSAGAFGHNWGHKLRLNGLSSINLPEDGPHFEGPFGPTCYARLKAEYGPIWGDVNFEKLSMDYFVWRPPEDVAHLGGCFVNKTGSVDVDRLWLLPEQFDCLWPSHYPSSTQVGHSLLVVQAMKRSDQVSIA